MRPIIQLKDNQRIAVYESARAAFRATNIHYNHIANVCRRRQKHAGGYQWLYAPCP